MVFSIVVQNQVLNIVSKMVNEKCELLLFIVYFFKIGTQIHHDELRELKIFLTSTTTRKAKLNKLKLTKRFIEPVW